MNQITAKQYPSLAERTERFPVGDTILGVQEAQVLALAISGAIQVSEKIDLLKRHIFYGKKTDLTTLELSLSEVGQASLRAKVTLTPEQYRLLHSALGILTEAGEYAQTVIEHVLEGKPLDKVNLRAELGDTNWYQAIPANLFGWTFEEWMTQNIEKLRVRYPDKFTEEKALNRDLDAERQAVATTPTS